MDVMPAQDQPQTSAHFQLVNMLKQLLHQTLLRLAQLVALFVQSLELLLLQLLPAQLVLLITPSTHHRPPPRFASWAVLLTAINAQLRMLMDAQLARLDIPRELLVAQLQEVNIFIKNIYLFFYINIYLFFYLLYI